MTKRLEDQAAFPARRAILRRWKLGRWTLMLTLEDLGQMYGQLGSQSWEYAVTVTKDPR